MHKCKGVSKQGWIVAAALLVQWGGTLQAQTAPPKLASAYGGNWTNLDQPARGTMEFKIHKIAADGSFEGLYTRYAVFCSSNGAIPLKGKIEDRTVTLLPDFGSNSMCKDSKWTLELQPDGSLAGKGYSYFNLKAELTASTP